MSTKKPLPIIEELPDYYEWYRREKTDLAHYAASRLSPDLAISVTKLFWPDFILHEDCVFLSMHFDVEAYEGWKTQLGSNTIAIEKVMNHIHLAQDLLILPFENLSYENIAYFGNILIGTWQAALIKCFPERHFQVIGHKDEDYDDFVITFCQEK